MIWQSKPLGQPWHSLALVFVSLLLAYGAIYFYQDARSFISKSVEVKGEVIRLIKHRDGSYIPVVRYKDAVNKVNTFKSSSRSKPAAYRIGDEVLVLYVPGSSEKPRIKNFIAFWFFSVVMGGLSCVFMLASVVLWIYRRSIYSLAGYPQLVDTKNARDLY